MRIRNYSICEFGKTRFLSGLVLVDQIRAARVNQVPWFGLSQEHAVSYSRVDS